MLTLRHAIKINAPQETCFEAFSNSVNLASWHLGKISGEIAQGRSLRLASSETVRFIWVTESLIKNKGISQICIDGPGTSAGKRLAFTFTKLSDGRVLVALSHSGWNADDPNLPFCNTHWGALLHRLKCHCEQVNQAIVEKDPA